MVDAKTFSSAVWSGDLATVTRLISEGADVNVADSPRQTPLHLAIEQMWIQIVRLLISAGADVNALVGNFTPLMHAIDVESDCASQQGMSPDSVSTQLTELLLQSRAKPNEGAFEIARAYCNIKAEELLNIYASQAGYSR